MSKQAPDPDRSPLRDAERALIERAVREPWTHELRCALASACVNRGLSVGTYDTVDAFVDVLESIASMSAGRLVQDARDARSGLTERNHA